MDQLKLHLHISQSMNLTTSNEVSPSTSKLNFLSLITVTIQKIIVSFLFSFFFFPLIDGLQEDLVEWCLALNFISHLAAYAAVLGIITSHLKTQK